MIIPMTDDEIELYHKVQKVYYILSKKGIDQRISYILKSKFLIDIDDFMEMYLEDLYADVVCDGKRSCLSRLKTEWSFLTDEEQLNLIFKYLGYDNFYEYLEENIEIYYNEYLQNEILDIHWVEIIAYGIKAREELINEIKRMMEEKRNEEVLKSLEIKKDIQLERLSDDDLSSLHYSLMGITL